MNLNGPVIVYIGASGGIGRPGCKHLVKAGARVVLASRKKETLDEIQLEIDPTMEDTLVVPCDASLPGEVTKVLETTVKSFGKVKCVIIGIGGHKPSGRDDDPEHIAETLEFFYQTMIRPTHLAIFETQKFFRDGKANSESPLLVHLSSHAEFKDEDELPNNVDYRIAKEAGDRLLRSFMELLKRKGARATNIRPATVNTDKNAGFLDSESKKESAVQPEEIMDLILELLTKEQVEPDYFLDIKDSSAQF